MPPESYMIPLPTSVRWPVRIPPCGPVGQLDHARRLDAARVDAEQAAAAELEQRVLVEHLDLEPALGAEAHGDVGHGLGGEVGRRAVGEVAGEGAGAGEHLTALGARRRGRRPGRRRRRASRAPVPVRSAWSGARRRSTERGARPRWRPARRALARGPRPAARRVPDGRALLPRGERAGRVAQAVGVHRCERAGAHHHQRRAAGLRQHEGLSRLAVEPGGSQCLTVVADLARHGTIRADQHPDRVDLGRHGRGHLDHHRRDRRHRWCRIEPLRNRHPTRLDRHRRESNAAPSTSRPVALASWPY